MMLWLKLFKYWDSKMLHFKISVISMFLFHTSVISVNEYEFNISYQFKNISQKKKCLFSLILRMKIHHSLALTFVFLWHISWKFLFSFSFVSSLSSVLRPFSSFLSLFSVLFFPIQIHSPLTPLAALTRLTQ